MTNLAKVGRGAGPRLTEGNIERGCPMEKTRDLGSAVAAALGGVAVALGFLGLYAAVSMPVVHLLQRLG